MHSSQVYLTSEMFLSFWLEYLEAWSQFSALKQKVVGIVEWYSIKKRK